MFGRERGRERGRMPGGGVTLTNISDGPLCRHRFVLAYEGDESSRTFTINCSARRVPEVPERHPTSVLCLI